MNERVLELLIKAKNSAGPGIRQAQKAVAGFSNRVRAGLRRIKTVTSGVTRAFKQNWLGAVAAIYVVQRALRGLVNVVRSVGLEAAIEVENLRTRLRVVLGGVAEGNKVFEDMAELAGKVPKTYQEIMAAATDLSGVVRGGSEDVKKLMPIIVDISAATGIGVRETTSQIIRMYSAGAAAADMFRERGILAALGFQAGVKISSEETMKILTEQWTNATGKFVGASEQLKSTWIGLMSMLEDKWFNFKRLVGESGFFDAVKLDVAALNDVIQDLVESGDFERWAKNVGDAFTRLYEGAKRFIVMLVAGAGQVMDVWNEIKLMANSLREGVLKIALAWQHLRLIRDPLHFKENLKGLDDLKEKIKEVQDENTALASEAIIDYSEKWGGGLTEFIEKLQKAKEELADAGFSEGSEESEAALEKLRNAFVKTGEAAGDMSAKIKKAALDNAMSLMGSTSSMLGSIAQMFEVAQGESKKYAGVIKAIRIGEAVVNTAMAVTNALATGGPPPFNFIAAAAAGAAGAAQIATIVSQSFAQGTDTVPAMVSPGEMIVPRTMASAIRQGDLTLGGPGGGEAKTVNHNYYIQAVDAASFASLVQRNPDVIEVVIGSALRHNTALRSSMKESMA